MSDPKPRKVHIPAEPYPLMPIDADKIIEGDPQSRGAFLIQTPDQRLTGGVWSCQPCAFRWQMDGDEIAHCVEGRFTITTAEGETLIIEAGDMVLLPEGMVATWRVEKAIRVSFVVRSGFARQMSNE